MEKIEPNQQMSERPCMKYNWKKHIHNNEQNEQEQEKEKPNEANGGHYMKYNWKKHIGKNEQNEQEQEKENEANDDIKNSKEHFEIGNPKRYRKERRFQKSSENKDSVFNSLSSQSNQNSLGKDSPLNSKNDLGESKEFNRRNKKNNENNYKNDDYYMNNILNFNNNRHQHHIDKKTIQQNKNEQNNDQSNMNNDNLVIDSNVNVNENSLVKEMSVKVQEFMKTFDDFQIKFKVIKNIIRPYKRSKINESGINNSNNSSFNNEMKAYFDKLKQSIRKQKDYIRTLKRNSNQNSSNEQIGKEIEIINELITSNNQSQEKLEELLNQSNQLSMSSIKINDEPNQLNKNEPFSMNSNRKKKHEFGSEYYKRKYKPSDNGFSSNSQNESFKEIKANPQNEYITQGGDDVKDFNDLREILKDNISKLPEECEECSICLIDFITNSKATFLPCCHLFHTGCIKDWLKKDATCPICKYKLIGDTKMG